MGSHAKAAGFSLHCGVSAAARQRGKLERLCSYIARPPKANERLSLTGQGNVRYRPEADFRCDLLKRPVSAGKRPFRETPGLP